MKFDLLIDYKTKIFNSKKMLNYFIMNNGIAHIVCDVRNKDEVVDAFGTPGLEVLSDGFAAYIEKVALNIPMSMPVLVEINGCKFTEKEKEDIQGAFWNHYALLAYKLQKDTKRSLVRLLWFALCLVAITLLIFKTYDSTNNQIWLNILFLGFYFFGDAVIRGPILDNRTTERERIACIQLSCAKIIFTEDEPIGELSDEQAQSIVNDIKGYIKDDEI